VHGGHLFHGATVGFSAVIVVVGGYMVMQGVVDFWEFVLRLGFCLILAAGLTWGVQQYFHLINLLVEAVSLSNLDIRPEITPDVIPLVILLLVLVVVSVKALIRGALGIIFLDALLVFGPIFMLLGVLPQTQWGFQWWCNQFFSRSMARVGVALALRLGLALGLHRADMHLELFFGIAAFWLAGELAGWFASGAGRANAWGTLAQLAIVARLAGAVGGVVAAVAPRAAAAVP
jgi:hypothetical protein